MDIIDTYMLLEYQIGIYFSNRNNKYLIIYFLKISISFIDMIFM